MPALSFFIQLPVWWYGNRLAWWWRFISRSLLLVLDRSAIVPQLQSLFSPYHNDRTAVGRGLGFAMRLVWVIIAAVALLAVVAVLVVGLGGWLILPLGVVWGLVMGGWMIGVGLLATIMALVIYWLGYQAQPKQALTSLIDPQTKELVVPPSAELQNYASGAARAILADLPPQFSTGMIMRELANDPDIVKLCKRMELGDQPLLVRISQQSTKQSQVVQEQQFTQTAVKQGLAHRHAYLTTSDLFLALVASSPLMQSIITELGVQLDELAKAVIWVEAEERQRGKWKWWTDEHFRRLGGVDRGWTSGWTPTLRRFSTDVSAEVAAGRVPYIIGRDKEIGQVLRVLERATKSNVLLLGEPGVGKSSVVDGIAQAILSAGVSPTLAEWRVIQLDVAAMLAAAGPHHSLEAVLSKALDELAASHTILFIDAIEHLVDESGVGTVDASALIEPYIAAGSLKVIGSTTLAAYHRILEPKSAFVQHFQAVAIEEPSAEAAEAIVQGFVPALEQQYKVSISLPAIAASVALSQRYIHDRVWPEKAIDLMDETAVSVSRQRRQQVTAEDVAAVVAEKTGIPSTTVSADEGQKLANLETAMQQRVVGQDEAVAAVANALRRSRAGLADESKPMGVFLFVGPTGTGKTALAKTIAQTYFGSETAMIRLDMSEYQSPDSLAKLLGAAPGSPDFDLGGQLTTAVKDNPYTVVLLDELEKAHPRILDVFLQVFDDGHVTDSAGHRVLFTHTVIICTSNAGARPIQQALSQGYKADQIGPAVKALLAKNYFRPEFLNRFDDIVVFKSLGLTEMIVISRKVLNDMVKTMADKNIKVEVADDLVEAIARAGYDPLYGARPLRHLVQDKVENALAKQLLTGQIKAGAVVRLDTRNVQL